MRAVYRPGPLLPLKEGRDAALFTAVTLLCLMTVLGAMFAGAADRAAKGWARDMGSEATVQVSPRPDETGDQAAGRAAEVLAGTPGVEEAAALPRAEAEALLEPWLGETILPDLPLPQLVTVRLSEENPATGAALTRALAEAGLDARVDDHSVWRDDVRRAALTAFAGAVALALLAAAAAGAAIVFAARAGLEGRRDLIEILSLNGAEDGYIARLFQARYAWLAAVAGAAGGLLAIAVLAGLILSGGERGLTPALPLDWADLLWAAPAPLIAAALAALAARLTVNRLLGAAFRSETKG